MDRWTYERMDGSGILYEWVDVTLMYNIQHLQSNYVFYQDWSQTFSEHVPLLLLLKGQNILCCRKNTWKFSTPETKILVVLCFYAVFGVVALSVISVQAIDQDIKVNAILQYFVCEAAGSGTECDRSSFDTMDTQSLVIVSYLMLALVPTVSLIFVVNWRKSRSQANTFRIDALRKIRKSIRRQWCQLLNYKYNYIPVSWIKYIFFI